MLNITLPEEDAGTIFSACATRTRPVAKKDALLAKCLYVKKRAALYLEHAQQNSLHTLHPEDPEDIDAAELRGVYERVMVKGGERASYLKLKKSARYGRCPLCAQRDVKTLDHYLSKDDYPELSVYPANLVPCCFDCNHAKGSYRAHKASQQLFHPYFDNWSHNRLIKASLNFGDGVTVTYAIREPDGVDQKTIRRAQHHFKRLDLGSLYEQNAAVELVDRKQSFHEIFDADGLKGLRDEMKREARSRRRRNLNSWQSALYHALSRSNTFCKGGFKRIDDP
jgi:5-methylcytosine-specific restriction endonuclease McrA